MVDLVRTGWSEFVVNGTQTVAITIPRIPAGAMGAGLRITGGAANGGIYQSVALTAGETYTVAGVFKDNGSADAWAELFLVRSAPEDGTDVLSTPIVPQLDFETASLSDIEALFTSFSSMEYDVHEGVRDALLAETPTDPFN